MFGPRASVLQKLAEQAINMNIAFATSTGFDIELEIRVTASGLTNVGQRRSRQRRASEVGVENDSCCVYDRAQGIARGLMHPAFHLALKSGKSQVDAILVEQASSNFLTQECQHGTCRVGHRGGSLLGDQ